MAVVRGSGSWESGDVNFDGFQAGYQSGSSMAQKIV